uniref:Putative RagB-SusD domain-containing protein n=1 Tax=termite gut metagenome TaxID=433724 RepID=S0DE75_9ZZZZ
MAGCSLDVKMYDGIIAEDLKPEFIGEVSQGTYRLLKNDGGIVDYGDAFRNFGSDDVAWSGTSTSGMFDIYDYTRKLNDSYPEYAWELGYRTIGNCNLVIEMAQGFGADITPEQTVLMGENYYLRALCYFYLVIEFAQPYVNSPTTNPGLPLKLDSDPNNLPESRSTVAVIYDQIVKDLQDAITYMTLPDGLDPKANIYATKEAAQALLARVYLYMERWDEAYAMADAVIKSGRFSLEQGERFATYPQHVPEENTETIFAVRRTKLMDDASYARPGGMLIRVDNNGWQEICASSPYLELMEVHHKANGLPQDLRSRFVIKRFVEDGAANQNIIGFPEKQYNYWWFAYARKQAGDNPHYEYGRIKVTKQEDGTYKINTAADQALFKDATIQSESYNLGTRYYTIGTDNTKYIGRIEPETYDAATVGGKDSRNLVYAINKCSYQEQTMHLWSPIVSRLAEMYLIRAEVNAEKGNTQLALDDINVLRRRATVPEWTLANMATAGRDGNGNVIAKDVKTIVEEERMLELAWEGHRRFDVFRKRQTLDRRYPGAHTYRTAAGSRFLQVPYNSPSVCLFIPQGQYDTYPYTLEQNPIDPVMGQ